MKYLETIGEPLKEYFTILEPNFPNWLNDYINTKELLHQKDISVTCGKNYSQLFSIYYPYTSLDHSVGVALIIWHFTKDKKETLAGLFHDIATPAFKHCIDFLNGDYMEQETTEDLTTTIIKNSPEIMELLNKEHIKVSEVDNYHIYPIADNDTPKLSADRLEYSLSNALFTHGIMNKEEIKAIYSDIEIMTNEENKVELGFKTEAIAKNFVRLTSKLSLEYREDKIRYSMQFLADIIKALNENHIIKKSDLYKLTESEIIEIIRNSKWQDIFSTWENATTIYSSKTLPQNVYYVHHGAKIRYIDPLVNGNRISKINEEANKMIEDNLAYNMNNYVYLPFSFNK